MLAISVEIAESRSSPRGVSNLTVVVLPGAFILFRRTILERQPPKALDVGQLDGPGLLPPFGVRRIRVVTRDCTLNPFRRPVTMSYHRKVCLPRDHFLVILSLSIPSTTA